MDKKNETNRFFSSYHGIRILLDFSRPRRSRSFTEVVSRHKRYSRRRELPTKPKKSPWTKNLPHKKSHAEFPNLENFQNAFKSYITCCSLFGCTLFAEQRGRDTQALLQIFRLFWKPRKSLLKSSHHPPLPSTPGAWAARERRRQSPLSCSPASSRGSLCLP